MDRRDFLSAAAGSVATAATGLLSNIALGAEAGAVSGDYVIKDEKVLKQLRVVARTTSECVAAGQACVQHCQEQLIAGHGKEFANCDLAAHQMLAVCQMMGTLAAYKAKAIVDFVDGCVKACEACYLACKEHEGHFGHGMHLECKRCMEACRACRDACRDLKSVL